MQVISIVMLIPMSTAACERGFSLMNRIKSKGRSRLANSLMNNLMTISCNKEELRSFDPQSAINEWASSARRRPGNRKCKSTTCSSTLRTSDSETESDNESEHSDALSSDIGIIDNDNDEYLDYD